MRVLIIEDEPALRNTLARMLRRNFEVEIGMAESADEAIELLTTRMADRPFDFVVSDFNLLGTRTGGDVLEWVKEHASHLVQRFVFFSGNPAVEKLHPYVVPKGGSANDVCMLIKTLLESANNQ